MPVEEPELNAPAEVDRGGRGPRRPSRPHGTRHRHLPWRAAAHHGGTPQFAGAGSIPRRESHPRRGFPSGPARGIAQPRRSLPSRHRVRHAQGHQGSQGQPAALLRRHRPHTDARVHRHRALPARPRRATARYRAGNHARNRSPAPERGDALPADRLGLAQPLRRTLRQRRQHRRTGPAGRLHCRQRCPSWDTPSASTCWNSSTARRGSAKSTAI